jgi:hypothetical protein
VDDVVPRRLGYRLDDAHASLQQPFRFHFARTATSARVRAAEPETIGGNGAGLLEWARVYEVADRRTGTAPLPKALAAVRGPAGLNIAGDLVERLRDHGPTVTVERADGDRLTPRGAISTAAVALSGRDLVSITGSPFAEVTRNVIAERVLGLPRSTPRRSTQ